MFPKTFSLIATDFFFVRSDRLKEVIQQRLPDVEFPVHLSYHLVYSRRMASANLLTNILSMLMAPSADTTTTDDSDDASLPPIRNLAHGMKIEFKHISDAMETSMREVPRSYSDNPPDFSELSVEACLNYCPPILYNMVASICGLTNDIIDEPQTQRVKLSVEDQNRVAAICQDMVYLKHKGTVIPPKTLALGMTLRHLTADSRVNRLVANLGHAASYMTILRLETALAMRQLTLTIPAEFTPGVWASVAWDNIDFFNDTTSGSGSAHFVNGILMQRRAIGAVPPPRPSVRVDKALGKLPSYDKGLVDYVRRSKRVGPHQTPASTPDVPAESSLYKSLDDFLYMIIKHAHHDPSTVPPWTEFNQIISKHREMIGSPTAIYYLPLIEAAATEDRTIATILARTVALADELKLNKIVAVFDLAIYSKVQQLRWSDPDPTYRERVIPRLGEFHIIMSYLGILGKRFGSGGLSDILVESDLVASGSLSAALSGKHYNRAVRSHKVVFESLYRCLIQKFLSTLNEDRLTQVLTVCDEYSTSYAREAPDFGDQLNSFYDDFYNYLAEKASNFPTFRYWLTYLEMVQLLLSFIRASRVSDWEAHLRCLEIMSAWFFAYDRRNYSR